jgi:signal transduction histidine kinase
MIASQVLLVVFAAQWLHTQYEQKRWDLRLNLAKLFTDVQHQISDSLLLNQVIDPALVQRAGKPIAANAGNVALSPSGLHKVLLGAGNLSAAQEKQLFVLDTIVFNEMFASQMHRNGWDFKSEWINNNDSNKDGRNIFLRSDFFTQENGVLVKDYNRYLLVAMLPNLLFTIILLVVTCGALWLAFRSLQSQMKLSQLKDDFISNMSHELKTPISTVKLALEALGSYNVIDDPNRNREYLGMAASEMDRLELLATRVLNTSTMESGKMSLNKESVDLKDLTANVLSALHLRLQQAKATVQFEVKEGASYLVAADKLHLQGVLVNLLDNSMKYAMQPPHIHIKLSEEAGKVQLHVADNGPGIPEEYKEKIFEKFFRVPDGFRHNTKGFGLGLSYAAQVMKQHNGSINVANRVNGGCQFTLTF